MNKRKDAMQIPSILELLSLLMGRRNRVEPDRFQRKAASPLVELTGAPA